MEKNNIPEEVTITPVIKDVERLIYKLIQLILAFFKGIGNLFSAFIRVTFRLRKALAIFALVGALLGFFSISFIPRQYFSYLVVDFHIDSKLQLYADVTYFNTLIAKQKHAQLAEIFSISEEEAKTISSFELEAHYSYVENVKRLNVFHNELDTSIIKFVDFTALFEEEENPELGNRYVIAIYSTDVDLFEKMEIPLITFLERSPELQKIRLNNIASLQKQKLVHEQELEKLDTLLKVLNTVMLEQAKVNKTNKGTYISLGSESGKSDIQFNQLEVQNKYVSHSKSIIDIDTKLTDYSSCYNIVSHINPTGTAIGFGRLGRTAILGAISFLLGFFIMALKALVARVNAST